MGVGHPAAVAAPPRLEETLIRFDSPEQVAHDVACRAAGRHLLVLTDFDGTIAEIAPTPDEAHAGGAWGELEALTTLPGVTTGVVSGRRLADVRARAAGRVQFVAGLHGFEIAGPAVDFRHPVLDRVEPVIDALSGEAAARLRWCEGLYLEDKTYALTCHVRLAAPDEADRALDEFLALARPHVDDGTLRVLHGKKAIELVPNVDWHKGRAVEWIKAAVARRVAGPLTTVYIGDDRTDEDAFRSLDPVDVSVGVGPRPDAAWIQWRLENPDAVAELFRALAAARSARP